MSEYTPSEFELFTDAEMREIFLDRDLEEWAKLNPQHRNASGEDWDRWLAAHDAEVERRVLEAAETWREIPGYEGIYEVSDRGRVRSLDRVTTHAKGAKQHHKSQIMQPHKGKYWRVKLSNGESRTHLIHHLVLAAFVGPKPSGMVRRHLNDDKDDNRLVNLAYGTHSDNHQDAIRNGTHRETSKTHCPKGHPYEGDNLRVMPNGHRRCVTCGREAGRAQWEKRKDAQNAARRAKRS